MIDAPAPSPSRQDWAEVFALLDVALDLAPPARASWLASLGPGQARLSPLVQALLQTHARAATDDFLRRPAAFVLAGSTAAGVAGPVADAVAGSLVGPYRLLREIGRGGMATVWLAERADGLLQRQVALKLPHLSWGNHTLAERMARERNILASLTHPHIARLYDAGVTAEGRPYLALEHVDGQAIDAYATARALSVQERLTRILPVAQAVAHAHARLVVHRDLKPSNILVDAQGQTHLLDFGIARLLDPLPEASLEATNETSTDQRTDPSTDPAARQNLARPAHTQAVGHVLTPDYASPEQIRGEVIGTASDVYSLGVVAYELMAGVKPYQLGRQGAQALEAAMATLQVPPASRVATSPAARRALQGDLDAILEKALRRDISQRYATVEAFAQDLERHRARLPVRARPDTLGYRLRSFLRRHALAVATATAVSVALVAGLSVAIVQSRQAVLQAERAEQVKEFVLSIFHDADTDSEAGASKSAADLLKAARQRVAKELGGRPDVAVELMTAVGLSMVGQGLTTEAAALMQEAVALATVQLGPGHMLTCAAQLVHGEAEVELGHNKEAIAALKPCIDAARQKGDQATLNTGLRWLSTALGNDGRVAEEVEAARQAVVTLTAPRNTGKALDARVHMLTQWAYASALDNASLPGAVAASELALAASQQVYGQQVVPQVLTMRTMLALAQVNEGQIALGLRELDKLVPATVELLGAHHPRVSKTVHLVGNAKLNAGDVPGAIVAFEHSVAVEDTLQGSQSNFNRGMARYFLAAALIAARRSADALPLLDETLVLLRASVGPTSTRTLRAVSVHAWQLARAGQLAAAEAEFKTLEPVPWSATDLAAHQGRLADLRSLQGRHAEALALAQSAQAAPGATLRKDQQARALARLGAARLNAGDAAQALRPLQEARALYTAAHLGLSPDLAEVLVSLGCAQLQLGETATAVRALADAAAFWHAFDAGNRHTGLAQLHLAQARWAQGDKRAAAAALRQAETVLARSAFAADRTLLQITKNRLAG